VMSRPGRAYARWTLIPSAPLGVSVQGTNQEACQISYAFRAQLDSMSHGIVVANAPLYRC